MRGPATCPRCGGGLEPPGLWSNRWTCALHGAVAPLQPYPHPSADWAKHVMGLASMPVWIPWPLPYAWVVSALFVVGDQVTGIRGTATALSGPNPLGGAGDLLLVAEEPGVGLGARYAGLPGPDPGDGLTGVPDTKLPVGGRQAPLWCVPDVKERSAYVGESEGLWLWAVFCPESASALLLEDLRLVDLRDLGDEVELVPYGALPPWLSASETT